MPNIEIQRQRPPGKRERYVSIVFKVIIGSRGALNKWMVLCQGVNALKSCSSLDREEICET